MHRTPSGRPLPQARSHSPTTGRLPALSPLPGQHRLEQGVGPAELQRGNPRRKGGRTGKAIHRSTRQLPSVGHRYVLRRRQVRTACQSRTHPGSPEPGRDAGQGRNHADREKLLPCSQQSSHLLPALLHRVRPDHQVEHPSAPSRRHHTRR
uniref:(northern house mosquito) hypothetical protein n=1 Tax=Culex pipiens TaxID=7175 RepID=A0A8D8BM93_CULPI